MTATAQTGLISLWLSESKAMYDATLEIIQEEQKAGRTPEEAFTRIQRRIQAFITDYVTQEAGKLETGLAYDLLLSTLEGVDWKQITQEQTGLLTGEK